MPDTMVSLQDYIERVFQEHMEQHRLMATASSETQKVLAARLETMNEFRQSMNDQAAKFLTRDLFDAKMSEVLVHIRTLELAKARMDGALAVTVVVVSALVSLAVTLVTTVLG